MGVLYSSNPPLSSLYLPLSSSLAVSCPQQQTQYKAVSSCFQSPVVQCHGTTGETTSGSREYNIDVKCRCSPIQITKFYLLLLQCPIPRLDSKVSCQQRYWFPIQFRMQHAKKTLLECWHSGLLEKSLFLLCISRSVLLCTATSTKEVGQKEMTKNIGLVLDAFIILTLRIMFTRVIMCFENLCGALVTQALPCVSFKLI